MQVENTQSYADKTAQLMARLGMTKAAAPAPKTIEDAAIPRGAAPTTDIGVTRLQDLIPMPIPGMDLPSMKDLYESYVAVVESGAYLSNFTGLKGASVATNDPIELGKRRMSIQEVRVFEWWLEHGNANEFDWKTCIQAGKTPEGKMKKFETELQALNWMYGRSDLEAEHLYWIRANKDVHFQCVTAYAKIIAAGNDIQNGVPDSDPDALREYETCKKIIGTCDKNINDIMKMMHELLQPLQEAKNVVEARKHWAAKRAGIALKTVGTIAHRNLELNLQPVGGVTRPDEAPRGKRVERTGHQTLQQLVAVGKKRKAGADWRTSAPNKLHKGSDTRIAEDDPLAYRPSSPVGVPMGSTEADLTKPQQDVLLAEIANDSVNADNMTLWAKASFAPDEDSGLFACKLTRQTRGRSKLSYPSTRTKKMDVLIAAVNRALLKGRLTIDQVEDLRKAENIGDYAVATQLFTDARRIARALAKVPAAGGSKDTEMGEASRGA